MFDESALTGEPIPVARQKGESVRSGTLNAGDTFEIRATATAEESTYAGIVRLVGAAQTAKAPFIRLADRYALLLLPVTITRGRLAWLFPEIPFAAFPSWWLLPRARLSSLPRSPSLPASPSAAKRGIIVKGGAALDALARTHTVLFDKTGTLTVGGARLLPSKRRRERAPMRSCALAGSLEQASQHVVAAAIVAAAASRGFTLQVPEQVHEVMGSGLEGLVGGQHIRVGSHQLVFGAHKPADWACARLRRASWRSALSVFVCRRRPHHGRIAAG